MGKGEHKQKIDYFVVFEWSICHIFITFPKTTNLQQATLKTSAQNYVKAQ